MARIVVLTHEFDRFASRRHLFFRHSRYMMGDILAELARRGHAVRVAAGPRDDLEGDAAVLHVDCSVVPGAYLEFVRRFPVAVNGGVADITKPRVSGAVLERDASWEGPVIVKSSLNAGGAPERDHNAAAARRGCPPPHPGLPPPAPYAVHERARDVPAAVWDDPARVVERFIPERHADGYGMRTWVFCGAAERCTLNVGPDPLVKADQLTRRAPVPVPEDLREVRRRLGFDYGKFDFVLEEGRAVLLDANRTPGGARSLRRDLANGNGALADGFESLLK